MRRGYNKYGARKVKTAAGTFDSRGEHARWLVLVDDLRTGKIQGLDRQVDYPLEVNGVIVCKLRIDAVYLENGVIIYEDFKGVLTKEFKIKAKLFHALTGIRIRISSKKGCSVYPKVLKKKKEILSYGKTEKHHP